MINELNEAIEHQLKRYLDNFVQKNWGVFAGLLDENFTYYSDNCTMWNKSEFVEFMKKDNWLAHGEGYKYSDLLVHGSMSGDFALATYKIEFMGTSNGEPMNIFAIESTAFVKHDSIWKVIHSHTSNKT